MRFKKKFLHLALSIVLALSGSMLLVSCQGALQLGDSGKTNSQGGQGNSQGDSQSTTVVNNDKTSGESWVIYWYLCGSDLETKQGSATSDLNEMLKVTLPESVTIIIQTGGSDKWQNDVINPEKRQIWRYSKDTLTLIETWDKANMGDGATLIEFLNYCNANHPADRRMLLFWDHGGGSLGGVCNDQQYGMKSLSLPALERALAATSTTTSGEPLYDLVGFDACLMANIDTAAVFNGYARYMVASQEIEPGQGWQYTNFLQPLANNPKMNGAELGTIICDTYMASMTGKYKSIGTLSLIDITKLDPLLEAYRGFGDEALVYGTQDAQYLGAYGRVSREAENYYNSSSTGYSNMVDLGDLVALGMKEDLFPVFGDKLLKALDACVVYKVGGDGHQRASGLSCFYNFSGREDKLKILLTLRTNKGFNYFNDFMHKGKVTPEAEEYLKQARANISGSQTPIEEDPIVLQSLDFLEGYPLTPSPDGTQWQLQLGPEVGGQLAAVYMTQAGYYPSEDDPREVLLLLQGITNYFPHDFENGVFTADFQNKWGYFWKMQVYMEPMNSSDNKDLYAVPIVINDERYSLIVSQDLRTGEFEVLGAALPYDEKTGVAGKELYQLYPGDRIHQVQRFLLPEGYTDYESGTRFVDMVIGEPAGVDYDPKEDFSFKLMTITGDDALTSNTWYFYAVSFVMIDYAGNIYFSDIGFYSVYNNVVYLGIG